MYSSKIANYHIKPILKPLPNDPNTFKLSKRNKFTRLLIKALKKLKVIEDNIQYTVQEEVKKVEVDLEKLEEFISGEIYYFRSMNIKIDNIILGRNEYEHLTRGSLFTNVIELPYRTFMGVRVQLNPFISGVVFNTSKEW